jgi:phosphomannomutase
MDRKGEVMRRWVDGAAGPAQSYVDGLKVGAEGGWVLLRPDRVMARIHLHAEGPTERGAARLVSRYRTRVEALVRGGGAAKPTSRRGARPRNVAVKGG